MAPILSLPMELFLKVVGNLEFATDVHAVAMTFRGLHGAANDRLYNYFAKRHSPLGLRNVVNAGNVASKQALISAGARSRDGSSEPIRLAAARRDLEMVHLLVQSWVSPTEGELFLEQPLLASMKAGQTDVFEYLLDRGSTCSGVVRYGSQYLLILAATEGHPSIVEYLVNKRGLPVNGVTRQNQTALWEAAILGNLDMV